MFLTSFENVIETLNEFTGSGPYLFSKHLYTNVTGVVLYLALCWSVGGTTFTSVWDAGHLTLAIKYVNCSLKHIYVYCNISYASSK